MATNEYEGVTPPVSGPVVILAQRVRDAATEAAGMDAALSLRTLLLLLLVGISCASAPMPFYFIGVAATVWLALDVARLSWRKK